MFTRDKFKEIRNIETLIKQKRFDEAEKATYNLIGRAIDEDLRHITDRAYQLLSDITLQKDDNDDDDNLIRTDLLNISTPGTESPIERSAKRKLIFDELPDQTRDDLANPPSNEDEQHSKKRRRI